MAIINIFATLNMTFLNKTYKQGFNITLILLICVSIWKPTALSGANINKIDSLNLLSKMENNSLSAKDYFDLTFYEFHRDSLFRAVEYARKGIAIAEKEKDYETLGNLYNIKGYIHDKILKVIYMLEY